MNTAISPTRLENYPEWYQQVIKAADLAENSMVRGCMVIKPYGYAVWENIQKTLDHMIKATGHQNFYCPMFVPLSFLEKEAEHVSGFAKECAVVTHHRLEQNAEGKLIPAGELEEPLIIRPTSEAIIGDLYSKWIQSYRDLPVLYNQWANVVRWEMRTRLFLRTSEFLWQEGHTAHATEEEAVAETLMMLNVYVDLVEKYLAIPLYSGPKTKSERFPGAVDTYTIEAMMQDKKALQCGTSHYLGTNFAKAFNIKFLDKDGIEKLCHTTSWGVTTRLIGAMIMVHGDDDGLRIPPAVAPIHVIILPLTKNNQDNNNIMDYCSALKQKIDALIFNGQKIRCEIDHRDLRAGDKSWHWIKKGVPVKIEIGAREIEQDHLTFSIRTKCREKISISQENFITNLSNILEELQTELLTQAKQFMHENTITVTSEAEFYKAFEQDGIFVLAPWADEPNSEEKIRTDLKVTPRCVPSHITATGTCIFTGQKNCKYTIFARAY